MICSHNPSTPFSLSSSSGTPVILMLSLYNESLISLILELCSFTLVSLFFLIQHIEYTLPLLSGLPSFCGLVDGRFLLNLMGVLCAS